MSDRSDLHEPRLTIAAGHQALSDAAAEFVSLLKRGELEVEFYKPDGVDRQMPHSRDEIYVIASGSGTFLNGGVRRQFELGEVLFVPAGVEHRFEDFTSDFATWVFFFGPDGGQSEIEDHD